MSVATATHNSITKVHNTNTAIYLSALRSLRKGAFFVALFTVAMMAMQGLAMASSYTDQASRQAFAQTVTSIPTLGLLYGEPVKVDTPTGYLIYRTLQICALVASVWALMSMNRLLRGQEEDGRWELLLSGQTTTRLATLYTLVGGLTILGLMYLATVAGLLLLHTDPVGMMVQVAFMAGAGVVLPAAFFMGLGAVVSQLAGNGRRATSYGFVPLFVFFALRSIGNVVASNDWLKTLTPFGWVDKWHIVDNPHAIWAFVSALAAAPLVAIAVYLAGKRDLGDSIIVESDISKPHYALLGGVETFSLRRMRGGLMAWWLSALAMTVMIAGLAKDAANAVNDSEALRKSLSSLAGGSHSIELSFVGVSALFLGITLLAMMVNGVGSVRREEAKNYADTLLVNPVGRYRWLFGRWIILIAAAVVIITTSGIATWAIMRSQHIVISFWTEVGGLLSIMGPLAFILGVGVLLYGFKPRLTVPIAYAYVVWSFAIDLVGSTVKLNDIVQKSSIFHYISLVPAESPDWKASWVLLVLGAILVTAGSYLFNHRDLETE